MLNKISKLIFLPALIFATGCAHTIQVSPNIDELHNIDVKKKVEKNVGYYISSLDKEKEVMSPAGGGDRVKYLPYKDSEAALNTILSKTFSRVYAVDSLSNTAFIASKNISYIFKPVITTDSSSSSFLTSAKAFKEMLDEIQKSDAF